MRHTAQLLRRSLVAFLLLLLHSSHLITNAQEAPQLPPPLSLAEFLALVEDPNRDSWQQPDAVIAVLELEKGQRVAEIGAWSGYFTLRLAQAVGPTGHVTALELEEEVLSYLRQRVERDGLSNVTAEQIVVTQTRLETAAYDVIFVSNFYHHLHHQSERTAFLQMLGQALKPDGRLIILDFFNKAGMPVGPASHMRLSQEVVQSELQAAGLAIAQTFTFLPYQYIVIAEQQTGLLPQLSETDGDASGPHP
jgi:arsenite methyltransferase